MSKGKLFWTPWPYDAGFCITDDTDGAELDTVRLVYDLLRKLNLKTTKTVWPFSPRQSCGIPAVPDSTRDGITLENSDYLEYCKLLSSEGFEIALHGASGGNNNRESIADAFTLMEREFNEQGTYVCHSKNADNIYWEENIIANPVLRKLLKLYSKYKAFGEVPDSPYFWGDICQQKIRWIRLYRTRNTNTLAVNPSMPYFDENKPFVNHWFASTKRSFHDCTQTSALDKLCEQNGATVLYQYMHRYADSEEKSIDSTFETDAIRLATDKRIWVDNVDQIMRRLKAIQGIFIARNNKVLHIINTNSSAISNFQFELPKRIKVISGNIDLQQHGSRYFFDQLPASSITNIEVSDNVIFKSDKFCNLNHRNHGKINFGHGKVYFNLDADDWVLDSDTTVPAKNFLLSFNSNLTRSRSLSQCNKREELRMFYEQAKVILREILSGKRPVSIDKLLTDKRRIMVDQNNW